MLQLHTAHTAVHNRLWLAACPPVAPVLCDSTAAYCQACRVRLPTCHWLLQLSPLTVINTWIAPLRLHSVYITCTCSISITTGQGQPCHPATFVRDVHPTFHDWRAKLRYTVTPPATSTTNLSSPVGVHAHSHSMKCNSTRSARRLTIAYRCLDPSGGGAPSPPGSATAWSRSEPHSITKSA